MSSIFISKCLSSSDVASPTPHQSPRVCEYVNGSHEPPHPHPTPSLSAFRERPGPLRLMYAFVCVHIILPTHFLCDERSDCPSSVPRTSCLQKRDALRRTRGMTGQIR